ncbi:MAG TPA: NAD(P)/FAD-dependent oxidoreductase [Anaerolineales bacterium]|nr:NAD(P)/FAD-dependent oxidoreductase [Anaerolineales bacterium]
MDDVIIIGGGPAGSTLGSYLSMAGIKNIIFESSIHPRPHVGESMVTSTTRIFKEIGFLEVMEREGFARKFGAAWHAPNGREFAIEFGEFPQPGIDQEYTYHVDRSKLDLLLLKHAEMLGTKVYQGIHVKQVLFDGSRATGVRVNLNGKEIDLEAKLVVDASGRNTLLGNQLKMKVKDPIFNQYAVHAWFEDLDRGSGRSADFIHIYFLEIERGWVWQIPITDEITSVGVVADRNVIREAQLDLEGYFNKYIVTNPGLAHAMRNARRINDFKTEGDYSYSLAKFVGDGFLCVGDAARFVDPIFSSGVSVALYSAKYAAERIRLALEQGDFSEAMLKPYEERLRGGVGVWYEFIRLYYKLLPLFTHFIQSKQHRIEVLRLLQGEVYDRKDVPVLDAMREYIRRVEQSDDHLLRESLTSIPID